MNLGQNPLALGSQKSGQSEDNDVHKSRKLVAAVIEKLDDDE